MRDGNGETVREPARDVPVYGTCDVLVVGGGPAGCAAAVAAARQGASVVLLERYGHLGGLSTGGLVFWIDRMTDWEGNLVVAGFGRELMDRCGLEATLGPHPSLWGSKDPAAFEYWSVRTSAHRGTVTWAPTIDPEMLKLCSNDMVREAGVTTLFHCWAVASITEGERVRGVIFESKEGRKALLAGVTVDCTGDGDVFALAGAAFDDDIDREGAHARINTSFRFGNVDMPRFLKFRVENASQYSEIMRLGAERGVHLQAHPTPHDTEALFMSPKMSGFSPLKVADLTEVEFISRDAARAGLAFFRSHVPGFERAWLLDTASQIGTRHARRLVGAGRVSAGEWRRDGTAQDSIGLCPGMTPEFPTLEIPYASLVPQRFDGLMAAGRNLSADVISHGPLREVPECWVMGQGAGIGAALAVKHGVSVRDVPVDEMQAILAGQDVIVKRRANEVVKAVRDGDEGAAGSIHANNGAVWAAERQEMAAHSAARR
jgi:2-polyprenyl-6-methoxyphenol hydroxylase-like FAD-dependent oxidoreductase